MQQRRGIAANCGAVAIGVTTQDAGRPRLVDQQAHPDGMSSDVVGIGRISASVFNQRIVYVVGIDKCVRQNEFMSTDYSYSSWVIVTSVLVSPIGPPYIFAIAADIIVRNIGFLLK